MLGKSQKLSYDADADDMPLIAKFKLNFVELTGSYNKQKKIFEILNIFLAVGFNIWYILGAQKNRLIEIILLSSHNIYFGWEIKKIQFSHG